LPTVDPYSKMRLFKDIFVNIGDDQSIESNLSTFSSHLKSIKEIIDNANDESLVLVDEICSGTDPTLGSALSSSILKLLSSKNCISIVTTHIGDLKSFAYNTDGIENASLEFDAKTLSPNFNFVIGIPGQSFTFEIARKFNFPENLLSHSNSLLGNNENTLENLIKDLNENKQQYNELKKRYNVQNARLDGLIKIYDEKVTEIKSAEKSVIKKAKQDAEQLLNDANKLVEKTIKEIREKNDFSPKKVKEEFHKESSILTDLNEEKDTEEVIVDEFQINDAVRLKGSNTTGELIEINGDSAAVNANGIIIRSKLSDLEKISNKEIKKNYRSERSYSIGTVSAETRLDLRGMYSDEIRDVLEKFIYDAHINGLNEVTIVRITRS
jgi:DNA mismatch repair protein MutS2